ncbi:hypothetical protein [Plantibacter sp. YIM 135249]|uniref:hypothetical protein n=1 Tax=Plantibacter sp. YIM 135249 TaxID=3423918 RepID=UPI003D34FC77
MKRSPKWFASKAPWPDEAVRADAINDALMGNGLDSTVEDENAGGRVGIRIRFHRCRFAIEVKRTVSFRDDDALVADYGVQATQYTSTDVPVAILAVADYHRRSVRMDLPATFYRPLTARPDLSPARSHHHPHPGDRLDPFH